MHSRGHCRRALADLSLPDQISEDSGGATPLVDVGDIRGVAGTYQEQTEKIIAQTGLAILAPPRVYALCLGTGGTALVTALLVTPLHFVTVVSAVWIKLFV
ncbi:hypothetical protein EVAR_63930_1 [Eumeta japonica]|uniref:Uncharacterized protein n=1 Tax=Eumeta variegata TaxID=151549 RepID=A0A4C1ZLC7_EUMVA|nr:hypothetical protein EVAR_63930_1 [Eumeta japonica]